MRRPAQRSQLPTRSDAVAVALRLCILSMVCSGLTAQPVAELENGRAREIVERALDSMGRSATIAGAGGLTVRLEGSRNLAAERQGRTPESLDRVPFFETITWDPLNDRLAREYRYDRHDGTFEWLKELYEGGQDRKILILQDGFGVWLRSPRHAAERRGYERRIPQLLLGGADTFP